MMLPMKYVRIILILLTAALYSCPCVTDLDTPKITEPEKYAEIVVVNCIWQSGTVKISDKYEDTLAFANYSGSNIYYIKAAADIENYLRVTLNNSGRVLYQSAVNLRDREKLSFIPYGDTLRTAAILLNDSISNYSQNNVYIRVVNLLPDSMNLSVKGVNNFPVNETLNYSEYSNMLTTYSGKNSIGVYYESGNTATELKDFNFEPGKYYILIIRRSIVNPVNPELFVVDCGTRK